MTVRPNVMISSTERDLQDYRWAASNGVIYGGMYPIMRELRLATDLHPVDISKQMIEEADIFVGIYAQSYGGQVHGFEKSWIEFEYDLAYEQKKQMLIYQLHRSKVDEWNSDFVDTGEKKLKLDEFMKKLYERHTINFFTDEEDLYLKIGQHLRTPPYSEVGKSKLIVNPLFGKPQKKEQYKAYAFMVMPFKDELRPVYEDHVKPVVNQLGMSIKRADDFFANQGIMEDIWSAINEAELVVADCTDKNPNVFYEIGIAHTLGKPTILLTQNPDDVPFDLRHLRYIKYDFTPRGMKEFMSSLEDAIKKILQ